MDTALGRLLSWCLTHSASDLHGQPGKAFTARIHGKLRRLETETFPAMDRDRFAAMLREAFSNEAATRIESDLEVDLSFAFQDQRFRANFSRQKGDPSFSLRSVPSQRLKTEDLQLPASLREILKTPRGLVLATGPTSQGKSTTLRALIQELNESVALRIVTVEDPVEYVFSDALSYFEQREVGVDTPTFAAGIRNAMRQDPDVIFVGEIRDRESVWASMQAAETGHLVLTTLHADSVAQAIGRIREFYPATEQEAVSALLARNLNAIVCQRLVPNRDGTLTPCLELMRRDAGVQKAIAENKLNLLSGIIEQAVDQGMHSFDQYLQELLAADVISREVALEFAVNRHRLEMTLRGFETSESILIRES